MTIFDDIRLLRVTYLRGPNLWTRSTAIEAAASGSVCAATWATSAWPKA